MEGAHFRQEQDLRLALLTARTTAVFVRWPRKRRLPTIDSMMKPQQSRISHQTRGQQEAFLRDWVRRGQAKGLAIKIGRLDAPAPPSRRRREAMSHG